MPLVVVPYSGLADSTMLLPAHIDAVGAGAIVAVGNAFTVTIALASQPTPTE